MRVAFGFNSHSGWAVLVVIGAAENGFCVVDRRRIELIENGDPWAKQPYHSAEHLEAQAARELVKNGIESVRRVAIRQMGDIISHVRKSGHEIAGCAIIVPEPMPDWSTNEILAVHFRMHKAEGVLFPDVLRRAAEKCNLPLLAIREKQLIEQAEKSFDCPMEIIAELGKSVGPPWGKDQKNSALAAIIVLQANAI